MEVFDSGVTVAAAFTASCDAVDSCSKVVEVPCRHVPLDEEEVSRSLVHRVDRTEALVCVHR